MKTFENRNSKKKNKNNVYKRDPKITQNCSLFLSVMRLNTHSNNKLLNNKSLFITL